MTCYRSQFLIGEEVFTNFTEIREGKKRREGRKVSFSSSKKRCVVSLKHDPFINLKRHNILNSYIFFLLLINITNIYYWNININLDILTKFLLYAKIPLIIKLARTPYGANGLCLRKNLTLSVLSCLLHT